MLNGVNLASFSLVDCVQTLLGQRLEVLPWRHLAELAQLHALPESDSVHASGALQVGSALLYLLYSALCTARQLSLHAVRK